MLYFISIQLGKNSYNLKTKKLIKKKNKQENHYCPSRAQEEKMFPKTLI